MSVKNIVLVMPAFLLAACAWEPLRQEQVPEPRVIVKSAPPSAVDQLLLFAVKLRKLETRELAAEREHVRVSLQKDASDFNRVKYALAIFVATGTPASGDDVEIIGSLDPVVLAPSTVADADVRFLAALLHGMAQERRKLREQLRDAQIRLNLAKRDDTREAETRALRARVEELEKKLSALKSIDRSVNNRAESASK